MSPLRVRSRIGKYRITRRLADSAFGLVFAATDELEGVHVALKVPHEKPDGGLDLDAFKREVRMNARLDHPNILSIKDASILEGRLVIVTRLGEEALSDRLTRRIGVALGLDLSRQILAGLQHAHERRVIHCDIKPDNFILFPGGVLRLTDFGIARLAMRNRNLRGSGSGTVGYMAPEQAMGQPSFRADVFSAALVIWRILSGRLPEYPFRLPLVGTDRMRARVPIGLRELLLRNLSVDPRKRQKDAVAFHHSFLQETRGLWDDTGRARSGTTTGARRKRSRRGSR